MRTKLLLTVLSQSICNPDFFVPAFDLTIRSPNQGEVRDYSRSVDFQTGETAVRWSDDRGDFERRMFVSRADGMAVLATAEKPNILLLISEDRGYRDVVFRGNKQAVTLHLDKPMVSGARRTTHCTIEKNHNHET